MLWAIVIGFIVGALAKFIMPGKDPGGFIVTILLGIAGAMLANWIGSSTGRYGPNEAPGMLASLIGALVILGVYRAFAGRKRITH